MAKHILFNLFLLSLPFVIFFIWRAITPNNRRSNASNRFELLLLIGALLVAGVSVTYNLTRGSDVDPEGRVWVPSYTSAEGDVVDGFFVPAGEFTTRAAAREERGLPPAREDVREPDPSDEDDDTQ